MISRFFRPLAVCLAWVYRAWYATLRVRVHLPDGSIISPGEYRFHREIFALCERDVFAFGGILARSRFTVLVAHGRDGDWATWILESLGCRVIRGSSRRGGAQAARTLIEELEKSRGPAGIVVDGPLGPLGKAKSGAAFLSAHSRRPLHPLAAAASRQLVFSRAWSRIYLPVPFSSVAIVLAPALPQPGSGKRPDLEPVTLELTRRLEEARGTALRLQSAPRE